MRKPNESKALHRSEGMGDRLPSSAKQALEQAGVALDYDPREYRVRKPAEDVVLHNALDKSITAVESWPRNGNDWFVARLVHSLAIQDPPYNANICVVQPLPDEPGSAFVRALFPWVASHSQSPVARGYLWFHRVGPAGALGRIAAWIGFIIGGAVVGALSSGCSTGGGLLGGVVGPCVFAVLLAVLSEGQKKSLKAPEGSGALGRADRETLRQRVLAAMMRRTDPYGAHIVVNDAHLITSTDDLVLLDQIINDSRVSQKIKSITLVDAGDPPTLHSYLNSGPTESAKNLSVRRLALRDFTFDEKLRIAQDVRANLTDADIKSIGVADLFSHSHLERRFALHTAWRDFIRGGEDFSQFDVVNFMYCAFDKKIFRTQLKKFLNSENFSRFCTIFSIERPSGEYIHDLLDSRAYEANSLPGGGTILSVSRAVRNSNSVIYSNPGVRHQLRNLITQTLSDPEKARLYYLLMSWAAWQDHVSRESSGNPNKHALRQIVMYAPHLNPNVLDLPPAQLAEILQSSLSWISSSAALHSSEGSLFILKNLLRRLSTWWEIGRSNYLEFPLFGVLLDLAFITAETVLTSMVNTSYSDSHADDKGQNLLDHKIAYCHLIHAGHWSSLSRESFLSETYRYTAIGRWLRRHMVAWRSGYMVVPREEYRDPVASDLLEGAFEILEIVEVTDPPNGLPSEEDASAIMDAVMYSLYEVCNPTPEWEFLATAIEPFCLGLVVELMARTADKYNVIAVSTLISSIPDTHRTEVEVAARKDGAAEALVTLAEKYGPPVLYVGRNRLIW